MNVQVLAQQCFREIKKGWHRIQDHLHYAPRPWVRARKIVRESFSSAAIAKALADEGICILENYLDRRKLEEVKCEAEKLFADLENRCRTTNPAHAGYYDHLIDFTQHPIFVDLILDELVLAGIEAYYSREIYLVGSKLNWLLPVEPYEGGAFQWHHDTKGKYVKVMWLLTGVSSDGQRMSYMAGSHRARYPRSASYQETRFSDQKARASGRLVECAGSPGTVIIFDTNGLHRGNRNSGPRRDALFGIYSAGRYRLGCNFELKMLPHLTDWQVSLLKRSRHASKGFERQ